MILGRGSDDPRRPVRYGGGCRVEINAFDTSYRAGDSKPLPFKHDELQPSTTGCYIPFFNDNEGRMFMGLIFATHAPNDEDVEEFQRMLSRSGW